MKAQAHLGRHRHAGRHSAAHRGHNAADAFRVLQQSRTAAVAVDDFGRATEVQVNAGRAHVGQAGGVVSHARGVRAQQLRAHRHTGRRAAAVEQLRHDADEHALG